MQRPPTPDLDPEMGQPRPTAWHQRRSAQIAAACAVGVLAIIAGVTFSLLMNARPSTLAAQSVAASPSDSPTPSPSPTSSPSATPSRTPSATPTPTPTPTSSPIPTPSPEPTPPPFGGGDVMVELYVRGHVLGPEEPEPAITVSDDGLYTWTEYTEVTGADGIVSVIERPRARQLTVQGLDTVRRELAASGYLDEAASYEYEKRPGVEHPGRGVNAWIYLAAHDGSPAVVSSMYLADDDEQYFIVSDQLRALHDLGLKLLDLQAWLDPGAWAGPATDRVAP